MYDVAMAESVRLWQATGTPQASITYVQKQLSNAESPELQGRLAGLLSKWVKRMGTPAALRQALRGQTEVLKALTEPGSIADALCNLVDLCVDMHRVETGMAYARDMLALLERHPAGQVASWEAPFLHNYGRLLSMAGDHAAAIPRLERSRTLFLAQQQADEAACVAVALGSSLLAIGEYDKAEDLCRLAKKESGCNRVAVDINVLQSHISMAKGELAEAGRLLERAISLVADTVGRADFRIVVQLLQAEADLELAQSDQGTARRIRLLAQTWAAAGRTDL